MGHTQKLLSKLANKEKTQALASSVAPSGNKYIRKIFSRVGDQSCHVDVYNVIDAFDVRCPAVQHSLKKLLCAGIRGKGDSIQDLTEARDAIDRALELERQRQGTDNAKSDPRLENKADD